MVSFLARYQKGEHQKVWEELIDLGSAVRDKRVLPDAVAVAKEMMQRVRHNIDIVIPRLEELGYEFGYTWLEGEPDITGEWIATQPSRYAPPPFNIEKQLQTFEELAGPLPLSIRAFYTEVGEVNFFGRHVRWEQLLKLRDKSRFPIPNLDPLAINGFKEEMFEDYVVWKEEMRGERENTASYPLFVALDYELKYNISGAGAYEIDIPNASADGLLLNEWHKTSFVDFLRICLHYGGLPGLESIELLIPEELAFLRKDLLPF
jgi:hypothetical protein